MPSTAFIAALPFVLRWEGGFIDHPDDPGGRTSKGITQKVYDQWRERQGAARQDVKLISDHDVHAIYEAGYWLPARCDLLEHPLDLVQFDTGVNMGVGRAVRFLQHVLGCPADGDFGPGTAAAFAKCDRDQALVGYCDAREAFYRRLAEKNPKLAVFLKGWLNRLNALRKEAGLPGFEGTQPFSFGDTAYIKRIPDLGQDPQYDF